MDIIQALNIINGTDLRPFNKADYGAWAVSSKEGPHEIGYNADYCVVRDGNLIEIHNVIIEDNSVFSLTLNKIEG